MKKKMKIMSSFFLFRDVIKHYSIFCNSFQKTSRKKNYLMVKEKLYKRILNGDGNKLFYTLELSLRINLHCLIIIIVHILQLMNQHKASFKRIPKELFFHSFDYLYQCKHMKEIHFFF